MQLVIGTLAALVIAVILAVTPAQAGGCKSSGTSLGTEPPCLGLEKVEKRVRTATACATVCISDADMVLCGGRWWLTSSEGIIPKMTYRRGSTYKRQCATVCGGENDYSFDGPSGTTYVCRIDPHRKMGGTRCWRA
jgi:hypothetical protein